MRKSTATAITTTCIGIAAAGTALMLSGSGHKDMRHRTKQMRRTTGKALRQVGSFLENASYMMR